MGVFKTLPLITILLLGCNQPKNVELTHPEPSFTKAIAVVHPIGESGVTGTVNFQSTDEGVSVMAELTGLTGEKHGFHIHQYGDCSATDGTSAGGHFNPKGKDHSNPQAMNRHMGDMGNIVVGEDGTATLEYVDSTIIMSEIIGRGIIVHAGEDDMTSQPSGAAGSRIACGVIGVQK